MSPTLTVLNGNAAQVLRGLPDNSVQVCVTSPPYWGLRCYGTEPQIYGGLSSHDHVWRSAGRRHRGGPAGKSLEMVGRDQSARNQVADIQSGETCECGAWRGQLGHEPTPALFIDHLTDIFREVRRVLRKHGTCWVNMGDCYAGGGRGADTNSGLEGSRENQHESRKVATREKWSGLAAKQLIGQPWMLAFAMQRDGWWLRRDIIWSKGAPMPESAQDRPTTSHEYIFMFSKAPRYYYDRKAASEPVTGGAHPRGNGVNPKAKGPEVAGWAHGPGSHTASEHNTPKDDGREEQGLRVSTKFGRGAGFRHRQNESFSAAVTELVDRRNWRSVWNINSTPFPEAHFAVFPAEIPKRAIMAGSRPGDMILDPFGGSGTTGKIALELGRSATLVELKPEYCEMIRGRCAITPGLALS